jgi:hypothetical protein
MRIIAFAFSVFLAFALPARGEGAFSVGIPEGGLRDGFAYGLANSYPSREIAEERSLAECRRQAERFGVPPSRCKLVSSYRKQCVSIAFDGKERWAGWAIAATAEQAAADAIKACLEGAKNCVTSNTDCDR